MRIAFVLAVMVGTLTACTGGDSADQIHALGTVELYTGDADRDQVTSGVHLDVASVEELARVVDGWSSPAAVELSEALGEVDIDDEFVVVVEYDQCGVDKSGLRVDGDDLRFELTDGGWDCAHAMDVIDVFAVDWDATGDDFELAIDQFGSLYPVVTVTDRTARPAGN